jgi:hypothetical protein
MISCSFCPLLEGSVSIVKHPPAHELDLIPRIDVSMAVNMQFLGLSFTGVAAFGTPDESAAFVKTFKITAAASTSDLINLVVGGITKAITGSEDTSGSLLATVMKNMFEWLDITVEMSLEYKGGFDMCFSLGITTKKFGMPNIELCTGSAISALGDIKNLLIAKGKDFVVGLLNGVSGSISFDTADWTGGKQICTPKIGTEPALKWCKPGGFFPTKFPCGFKMGGTTLFGACMSLPSLAVEASVSIGPGMKFEVSFKAELGMPGGSFTVLGRTLALPEMSTTFGPITLGIDLSGNADLCTLVPAIKDFKIPGIRFPAWDWNFGFGFTGTFDPSGTFGIYTDDNYLILNTFGGQCPQIGL